MRILVTVGGFSPAKKFGGPAVSIENMVNHLDNHEFFVITRDHDWKSKKRLPGIKEGWNTFNNHTKVNYLPDSVKRVSQYIDIIREISPDLIYINGFYSLDMVVPLIRAAQKEKVPILLAPRGTLNKNAMALKKVKKYPYIAFMRLLINKKFCYFQSTSDEETERIHKILGIEKKNITLLENLPSRPNSVFQKLSKVTGDLKCCFFARICESKNLLYALNVLKMVKTNITFSIYGIIEDQSYWQKCKKAISTLPQNVKVEYKGEYNHQDVFNLMSQHHVFFFPTLTENYGHVIVEALLAGLPVVISDQTPWNGVNNSNAGYALPLNDEAAFKMAIESFAGMNQQEFEKTKQDVSIFINRTLRLHETKLKYDNVFRMILDSKL